MSRNTSIAWASETLNTHVGCQKISPACTNCYAAGMAKRFWPAAAAWDGTTVREPLHKVEAQLEDLVRSKKPRRIFCGSMTDMGLVAENDPIRTADFLTRMLRVQRDRHDLGRPLHAFLWLTKRPQALARFFRSLTFEKESGTFRPDRDDCGMLVGRFPGLWLGITAEDQPRLEDRWGALAGILMAEQTFISAEPLLVGLDLERVVQRAFSQSPGWLITGGETGQHARPSNPAWFRSLRDQAERMGMPFWFKSWGVWTPHYTELPRVGEFHQWPDGSYVQKIGATAAGHLLDGVEHQDAPPMPSEFNPFFLP